MVELPELRTAFSKTFDEGGGLRRIRCRVTPMHYRDAQGNWIDIDLDSMDVGFVLSTTPYIVEGRIDVIGMRYTSKTTGEVLTCRLIAVDGTPVTKLPLVINPQRSGRSIVWANCLPDVTIGLRVLPGGVSWIKRLSSATAPRSFTWRIEHPSIMTGIRLPTEIHGQDNTTRDPVDGRTVRSFPLELTLDEQLLSDDGITRTIRLTETWTGRIVKKTGPATDVVYPVSFDPSFQETITANADDGEEYNDATWDGTTTAARTGSYYGTNTHCGLRFTVGDGTGPASGATITSATLSLMDTAITGSPNIKVVADDVDNAAAWGSASRPSQVTQTTASTTWQPTGGGPYTVDVTSIVQEIVSRGGWAQGNAMRFALLDQGTGNAYVRVVQLEHVSSDEADLDITYTAGRKSLVYSMSPLAAMIGR